MQRVAELDGLRGVAVLLVIAFHAWPDVFVGGSYGVIVFFTISGFLITRSLVNELDSSGRVDFRKFYFRRVVRLVPALAVVTTVYVVAGGAPQRALAALTYTANFARIGDFELGAIHHTWSLAVEEHFYLLWPLVIAILPPRHRLRAFAVMVVVFAGWRGFVITLGAFDWVYYGTTTNAVAILAGCLAAIAGLDRWRSRWWMLVVGLLPMLVVHKSDFYYWAGFLVIAATVGVLASPPKWLAWKPLAYVGLISYSLYLWHYMLLTFGVPVVVALVTTFAVAALSWKVLEEPLLRRGRQAVPVSIR